MQRLEVSGAVRPICGLLGVKRLILSSSMSEDFQLCNFLTNMYAQCWKCLPSDDLAQCCSFVLHSVWFLLLGVMCEQQVAGNLYATILECLFPSAQISL